MINQNNDSLTSSEISLSQAERIQEQARRDQEYYETASFRDVEIHSELFGNE